MHSTTDFFFLLYAVNLFYVYLLRTLSEREETQGCPQSALCIFIEVSVIVLPTFKSSCMCAMQNKRQTERSTFLEKVSTQDKTMVALCTKATDSYSYQYV